MNFRNRVIDYREERRTHARHWNRHPRTCLRCGGRFAAAGRFNKVCPRCHDNDLEVERAREPFRWRDCAGRSLRLA